MTCRVTHHARKVFLSFGSLEDEDKYSIPIKLLYSSLDGINKIDSHLEIFENGTHFTCPPEALAYGLKFVYNTTEIVEQK